MEKRRRLTAEQKAEIIRMRCEDRASVPEIAQVFGMSMAGVWPIVKPYPLTADERRQRRAKSAKKMRDKLIARGHYVGGLEWTSGEDAILRQLWPQRSNERILAAFPGRSWGAIMARAHKIGVRRSRETIRAKRGTADKLFLSLREIRESRGIERNTLAEKIGINLNTLAGWEWGRLRPSWLMFRAWLDALGYDIQAIPKETAQRTRSRRLWMTEEDEMLRELLGTGATLEEVATAMKRLRSEVEARAKNLGVLESEKERHVSGMTRARLG